MTRKGLEPSTSSVTGWHSNRLNYRATFYEIGGNNRARTCDPLLVRQMLSQLSYAPVLSSARLYLAATKYIIHYRCDFVNGFFKKTENFVQSHSKIMQYLEKRGLKQNTGAACSSACDSGLMHLCYGISLFSCFAHAMACVRSPAPSIIFHAFA